MEPVVVAWWSCGAGILYAAVALRLSRARRRDVREQVQDYYVIGWWALAATAFLGAARAAVVWSGVNDLGLDAMLRLGIVLAFVMATAALIAAGGSFVAAASGAVKSGAPARRAS